MMGKQEATQGTCRSLRGVERCVQTMSKARGEALQQPALSGCGGLTCRVTRARHGVKNGATLLTGELLAAPRERGNVAERLEHETKPGHMILFSPRSTPASTCGHLSARGIYPAAGKNIVSE